MTTPSIFMIVILIAILGYSYLAFGKEPAISILKGYGLGALSIASLLALYQFIDFLNR